MRKRFFDLVVVGTAAVVWGPALIACALAIFVLEGRPVFYVSRRRVGREVIPLVKFRTMKRDVDRVYNRETVPVSNNVRFLNTPPDSPLYTRIGRLIERLALTEIPQVLHVLTGHMSLVGNRPLPDNVTAALREVFPSIHERLLTPAGMTGPVQLVGRLDLSDHERVMLEILYCRVAQASYSCWLDLTILWNTVLVTQGIRPALSVAEVEELLLSFVKAGASVPQGLQIEIQEDAEVSRQ